MSEPARETLRFSVNQRSVRTEPRKQPSKLVRRVLGRAQDGLCALCAEALEDKPHHYTVDHVVPLGRRGPDAFGNIVAAHKSCNSAKADRMPTGCELIWLLAVNARLGVHPQGWRVVTAESEA